MSRLDSFIRRLQAQRDCLNAAVAELESQPGCILELGLGNGRTYDHLRSVAPGREIFVFDRQIAAHPECIPPDDHLFIGALEKTIPIAFNRLGPSAILAHCDLGSGDSETTRRLATWLGPALNALLKPDALVVSDQELNVDGWRSAPLPRSVPPGRYFIYQKN